MKSDNFRVYVDVITDFSLVMPICLEFWLTLLKKILTEQNNIN